MDSVKKRDGQDQAAKDLIDLYFQNMKRREKLRAFALVGLDELNRKDLSLEQKLTCAKSILKRLAEG